MARKKIDLFIEIHNDKEFHAILNQHRDKLICAEIYCSFVGSCTALDNLFKTIKLDWSNNQIILLKVLADEIEELKRFHGQSQPFYMFIVNKKVTKVFRGVDGIRFGDVAKKEIQYFQMQKEGMSFERDSYDIDEATSEETDWLNNRAAEALKETTSLAARRAARQAARKRHRAELMLPHLQQLNFVLFWPHATHAHPELYERWNLNNIIMVGREELELTKELAEDILYAGDAPINEASLHALLSGAALVICFRLLDTDKHFVSLVRKILYEEIPDDEDMPLNERKTAFDLYKSYSLSREEIRRQRQERRHRKREDIKEKRARRLSEMQRLAREAIEEDITAKRLAREQRKLQLLKSGKLEEYDKFDSEVPDEETDIVVPEELSEEEDIESSEDENEYFPPANLLIPGFYAPPNDVAKVNGLAVVFPKIIKDYVTPQPEFLPPHVLVLIQIEKRYEAIKIMNKYKSAIIHMGIFNAVSIYDAVHISFSVTQYDSMNTHFDKEEVCLAFMLSIQNDLPLIALMDLNPVYVSRDPVHGEEECATIFPVDYADEYPEFEDFEKLVDKL